MGELLFVACKVGVVGRTHHRGHHGCSAVICQILSAQDPLDEYDKRFWMAHWCLRIPNRGVEGGLHKTEVLCLQPRVEN